MDATPHNTEHDPRGPARKKLGTGAMLLIAVGFCVAGLLTWAATVIVPRARIVRFVERNGGRVVTSESGAAWLDENLPDELRPYILPPRIIVLLEADLSRSDLRELGSIETLVAISLIHCRFEPEDLAELNGLQELRLLQIVFGTAVSAEKVEELKAEIPGLVVRRARWVRGQSEGHRGAATGETVMGQGL